MVRFGWVRFGSVRFGSVRFGPIRFGCARLDSIRSYSTIQRSATPQRNYHSTLAGLTDASRSDPTGYCFGGAVSQGVCVGHVSCFVGLFFYGWSVSLSAYLLSICLSVLSFCLSFCLSVCLSNFCCLFVGRYLLPAVCLSSGRSASLSPGLPICTRRNAM